MITFLTCMLYFLRPCGKRAQNSFPEPIFKSYEMRIYSTKTGTQYLFNAPNSFSDLTKSRVLAQFQLWKETCTATWHNTLHMLSSSGTSMLRTSHHFKHPKLLKKLRD